MKKFNQMQYVLITAVIASAMVVLLFMSVYAWQQKPQCNNADVTTRAHDFEVNMVSVKLM